MKLKQLKCPSCGAGIELNLKGHSTAFCPYCGSQFSVDDGVTRASYEYTHNYNHNSSYHMRYTDDAAVEEARIKDRENERNHNETKWILLGAAIIMILCLGMIFYFDRAERKDTQNKIDAGMIQVGQSYEDMKGQDYHTVVAQLESAGFKNITTIDLNDTLILIRPADTIESVSIGGKTEFYSHEYYDPNTPIVISFH